MVLPFIRARSGLAHECSEKQPRPAREFAEQIVARDYNAGMKTTISVLLLALAITPAAVAATTARLPQDKPADVSGAWALTVQTDQGTGNPSVTFKQDGETLTGHYSSQVFGEQEVTGTIKGNAITFSFVGSFEGTKFTVTYTGTVDKDTMKGKISLGDAGEGTFTGKKQ
jgi:hypothetical protein